MSVKTENSKIITMIACAVLLAGCVFRTAVTNPPTATLPVAPVASPTMEPSPTPTATATPATVTPQPTDTLQPTTDWSNLRCVPKSAEDISRCPQSPSPVTDKAAFIDWFAKWAKQMDTYQLGPSVAYGYINTDPHGSHNYIITIASGGLAGTFWFAGENGQKVVVMALANGIFDASNLYRGQYNLLALVDNTSYQGLIGGLISQDSEIMSFQPNVVSNVSTLNMQTDGSNYLEKAVTENYPNGVLADGSTFSVGYIWKMEKF